MVSVNFLKSFILQEIPQYVLIRSEKLLKSNREVFLGNMLTQYFSVQLIKLIRC